MRVMIETIYAKKSKNRRTGAFHHIIIRGVERRRIFRVDRDLSKIILFKIKNAIINVTGLM